MLKLSGNQKNIIPACGRRSGFSLVELLVVIGIIVLLTAMGGIWMAAYLRSSKGDSTTASMSTLLVIADTLKTQGTIKPDHRLANYYWMETDLTTATNAAYDATASPTARQMSSAELLVYLAGANADTAKQLEMLGRYLVEARGINGASLPSANQGMALVYEQAPTSDTPVKKQLDIATNAPSYVATKFRLISPITGWRARTFVDSWGHEMAYRYYTDSTDLNAAANTIETIAGDAQLTPPLETKANGSVRPAVAGYGFPSFMSAGGDGKWGAFIDGISPDFSRDARAPDKKSARDVDALDNIYSQEKGR